jgi:hypothetical protein
MSSKYLSRMWPRREDGPPPKRISTPAGMRLSVIVDKGEFMQGPFQSPRSPRPPQLVLPEEVQGVIVTHEVDVQSTKKFPDGTRNPSPSPPYSQSIFSEKSVSAEERPTQRRPAAQLLLRRRLFIILAVAVTVLLALIIGLAAGLSKKHTKAYVPRAHQLTS